MPLKDIDLNVLAEKTENYVGADIEALCKEAAILALREDMKATEIKMKHFEKALEKVMPSVTKDVEKAYEDMQQNFRSAKAKQMQDERPNYLG